MYGGGGSREEAAVESFFRAFLCELHGGHDSRTISYKGFEVWSMDFSNRRAIAAYSGIRGHTRGGRRRRLRSTRKQSPRFRCSYAFFGEEGINAILSTVYRQEAYLRLTRVAQGCEDLRGCPISAGTVVRSHKFGVVFRGIATCRAHG